jgi:hypothetical protein
MGTSEAEIWDRRHRTGAFADPAAGTRGIFTDEEPSTTIKGCGFRNSATALQTLLLIEQPMVRYKKFWTVQAMVARAERHPQYSKKEGGYQDGMLGAVRIFRRWLEARERASAPKEVVPSDERAQREQLARSRANRHNSAHCKNHETKLIQLHTRDRSEAVKILQAAAAWALDERRAAAKLATGESHEVQDGGSWFPFPGPAFLALFGGPGAHGYGLHVCLKTSAGGPERFSMHVEPGDPQRGGQPLLRVAAGDLGRCGCAMGDGARHLVEARGASGAGWLQALARLVGLERLPPLVAREAAQLEQLDDPGGLASLQLGKHFPLSHFVLEWRSVGSGGEGGFVEEARFVKVLGDGRARQPSLRSYFGGPGTRVKRGASPLSPPRDQAEVGCGEGKGGGKLPRS